MRHRPVGLPGPPAGRHHRDLRRSGDPPHLIVAAASVELRLRSARSRKDKRAVLRSLLDGAHRRFGVAVAEVGHQDLWQRSTLGFAVVSGQVSHAVAILDEVERFVWSFPEVEVLSIERRWLEEDDDGTEGQAPWGRST